MGNTEICGYIPRRQCSRNATHSGDFCWDFACRCHVWGCGGELSVCRIGKKITPRRAFKCSLRETTGGNIVAVVDEDILSGIDLTQWNDTTKKQLRLLPEKR